MRIFGLLAAAALVAGLGIAHPAGAAPTGSRPDPDVQCFEDDNGDWNCWDVEDLAEDCKFTDPEGVGEECAWVNSQTEKSRPGHTIYQGGKDLTTQQPRQRTKTFVPQRTKTFVPKRTQAKRFKKKHSVPLRRKAKRLKIRRSHRRN